MYLYRYVLQALLFYYMYYFFSRFMLCADYEAYMKCQEKVSQMYTVGKPFYLHDLVVPGYTYRCLPCNSQVNYSIDASFGMGLFLMKYSTPVSLL